jgi:ketosteroid isomerase-like protein
MTIETGKAIVTRYAEAFNRGDADAVCALFAPDAQIFGVLGYGGLNVARPIWE